MSSHSKFLELKASDRLPSLNAVALQVLQLIRNDNVTIQEVGLAIKPDPAMSGRIIKVANAKLGYQTRPLASVANAIQVLGFSTLKQLVLGLSLIDNNRQGSCQQFDYHGFWSRSLLTAIVAQNLVFSSGGGSAEDMFTLGLLGQIGTLALATAYPEEYGRVCAAALADENVDLVSLERSQFGFHHNWLTLEMLADWGIPQVFQEVALYHEDPTQARFPEGSRGWSLLHRLHVADMFSRMCLAPEPRRVKLLPKLILLASRLGVELDALAKLGDKAMGEWKEWSTLLDIHSTDLPPFAELLSGVPLAPNMLDISDELPGTEAGVFYKLRVLLVDDDRAVQLIVRKILEKAGHTVTTASDGKEALGMIEEFKPQLIVTDWMMPVMNGIEFCKTLRRNPQWRNIYVFMLTSQEGTDSLVEAFEAGANDYMAKPVSPKGLMARLSAAQRVVQLQEKMEFDHEQLHQFADELVAFNNRLRINDICTHAILENSPYMTWLKDAEGRYIKANKAFIEYVQGKGVQQIIGKTDFDLWPKELAEKFLDDDTEVIAFQRQKRIEECRLEGGKERWLETFKTPVIGENGNLLGITGFARDITERRQAEEDLRIAATAFESWEGMMVTDCHSVILRVNHAFTEITGYTAEEACGQTPRLLKSGRHSESFYAEMQESLQRNGGWQGEIWNRRKNGEIYPQYLTISAVKTLDGSITHYVAALHDITERKAAEERIRNLALYDPLTQLPNRTLLNERLSQAMLVSKRSGRYGALMFLDLDNFKPLNDRYGHVVGDLLLIEVARRIDSCVRETDTVARFGGDEFVVIVGELDGGETESVAQASLIAEKIRRALAENYRLVVRQEGAQGHTVDHQCTSSIGVSLFIRHEVSQKDTLMLADMAMFEAKHAGRNRVVVKLPSSNVGDG